MRGIVAALVIAGSVLGAGGIARADDTDAAYLDALHKHGIHSRDGDGALIDVGHSVCAALERGYSMNALTDIGQLDERNGITDDQVQFVIKAAAASYCPQYIP
jgi:hypothetical protein